MRPRRAITPQSACPDKPMVKVPRFVDELALEEGSGRDVPDFVVESA
jgi:hypothetical protein